LDLRPIYHKNDDATIAHIHLGLLAYWLVNTIRYQLKKGYQPQLEGDPQDRQHSEGDYNVRTKYL